MIALARIIALAFALHTGHATCARAHYDDLAPEAQAHADTIHWSYPAHALVIDDRNGTVYPFPRRRLPATCRPMYEDEVTVVA